MFDWFKKKKTENAELLKKTNVIGFGEGYKIIGGTPTKRKCLQVYVTKKCLEKKLKKDDIIPKEINGIITDVIELGEVKAQILDHKNRKRPVVPGISGAHIQITAGTVGPVVYKEGIFIGDTEISFFGRNIEWLKANVPHIISKKYFWLTNAHVGALEGLGKYGDVFVQPGPYDGGLEAVGTLYSFATLKDFASIDACLIKPISNTLINNEILGIGKPSGAASPAVGMDVRKSGRTTGVTKGKITATGVTILVSFERLGNIYIKDCIIMSPMSKGGDSGSPIVDKDNNVVGLIFAGTASVSIGCDINNILKELNCNLVID